MYIHIYIYMYIHIYIYIYIKEIIKNKNWENCKNKTNSCAELENRIL